MNLFNATVYFGEQSKKWWNIALHITRYFPRFGVTVKLCCLLRVLMFQISTFSPFLSIPVTKGGFSHHFLKAAAWCVVIYCLPCLLHNIEKEGASSLRLHHHQLNFNRDLHITCSNRRVSRCTCYCYIPLLYYEVSKSARLSFWDFELFPSSFSFCGWF
jgi:hypothetical protein